MFFAYKTKQRLRIALAVCGAYVALAAAVAVFLPHDELEFLASFGWWLSAIPVGIFAYIAAEIFGTWSLGLPFWQRIPSWARVLLLVALISGFAVGAIFVSPLISPHGSL